MLELPLKIIKIALFCLYGTILIFAILPVHYFWPLREKIISPFWRQLYIILMLPLVGITYTVENFDKWFEKSVAKF